MLKAIQLGSPMKASEPCKSLVHLSKEKFLFFHSPDFVGA
ncbi:hypothetical protein NC651_012893 [Populus alba x Populus x berolinensis]|nr:hypothetical protein NC651_012893 [Populus alba x Populus x berolinensis]